ncbi:cytochrome C oxidase subunit IV family protein [Larkinella sp. VNQ87]|uniref:cytochrome C oxidase subunit IV family protein n=1 Tax=Larkinella sp. VNQ87 TaxID=3400921 RepID=UPI003C01BF82
MADHHSHHHDTEDRVIAEPQTKAIWRTFIILSVLTAFEFLIAFTVPAGFFKTSVFVIMTIVKAFYIVGEFMHLKHEVKSLIWAIILPCIFVVWLLLALLMEGNFIFIAK